MKKEHFAAGRKQKLKLLENQKLLLNIKDVLAPLVQQIREIRDFLNLHIKCMIPKPNLTNDLSDITCDRDLEVDI